MRENKSEFVFCIVGRDVVCLKKYHFLNTNMSQFEIF